jgi:hypothetical protein
MGDSFVNQVTLDCLLNRELLDKKFSNKIAKTVDKKDKKFYRKRIYNLTKELLLSKEEIKDITPDVKYAFNNFVKTCIHHFKTIDNNDIIQQDYANIQFCESVGDNINELNVDNIPNQEEADKLLMRSINMTAPSLDKFVKKKLTKPPEKMIIPKQKEINLKDPILKEKGIPNKEISNKGKKKNINNFTLSEKSSHAANT